MNGGDPAYAWTRAELIDAIVARGSEREPDRRFAYRNGNYVIAAEIAERAGGRDIGALLDELIARPLGLETMSFAGSRLVTPHLVMLRRAVDLLAVTGGRVPTTRSGRSGATAPWRPRPPIWRGSSRRCSRGSS